jgi:hypothetical protein
MKRAAASAGNPGIRASASRTSEINLVIRGRIVTAEQLLSMTCKGNSAAKKYNFDAVFCRD